MNINFKEHKEMRYPTLGDYYVKNGVLNFDIVKQKESIYTKLILIHELIEQTLCEYLDIKIEDIDKHDLWFEEQIKLGLFNENDEPGEHLLAPYRKEHLFSESIEKQVCEYLKIDFNTYNNAIKQI
jgi:hypothetical protein